MQKKNGALPYQVIKKLIAGGHINHSEERRVSPSSIDLTLSSEAYRVNEVFLPMPNEKIRDVLKKIGATPHSLSMPMEKDVPYLIRINEIFSLPKDIYGFANPKSSTGRNDVHVRMVADGISRYDSLYPSGFSGEVWVFITPKSFPVIIPQGEALLQVRFFNKDTRLSKTELKGVYSKNTILFSLKGEPMPFEKILSDDGDGSLLLTLDLSQKIIGYECRGTNRVLDFNKGIGFYDKSNFFQPIKKTKDYIKLSRGSFYIISTLEAVRIPPDMACEMVAMDERSGEFRSHYAGFIDPGWGWGMKGEGKGRPLTLEVRPFGEDVYMRHGQPIGKIRLERLTEKSDLIYDNKGRGSNYLTQKAAKLSKHFKSN